MKTIEVEIAVANYFGYRQNLIVPNISWGMNLHECDMLICTKSNILKEVEIKVSKHDLIKDKEKKHKHSNGKIKELYFAIPDKLKTEIVHIPLRAGILIAQRIDYEDYFTKKKKVRYACHLFRKPILTNVDYRITAEERYNLARLGTMRIWSLKQKLTEQTHAKKSR